MAELINGNEASRKTLENQEEEIDNLLADDTKSTRELVRGILRLMKTEHPFLIQALADHARTMRMWGWYRIISWATVTMAGLVLVLLFEIFTHRVELVFVH